jgi:cation transport ATPase
MPLNVVCPGCKKRFTVSEKFAGQKGPCPQCKTVIEIPKEQEEVLIHAPEAAGPKDSKGTAVLKPILREETNFDGKIAGAIAGLVLLTFIGAWMIGSSYKPKVKGKKAEIPWMLQGLAALALAPPLALAGYSFLRNDELEPFRGKELAIRVLVCGAVYAALWGGYAMVPWALGLDKGFELFQLSYVVPPFILVGMFAAYASLELDFLTGSMHYGLYLIVTVLLRVVAGMSAF